MVVLVFHCLVRFYYQAVVCGPISLSQSFMTRQWILTFTIRGSIFHQLLAALNFAAYDSSAGRQCTTYFHKPAPSPMSTRLTVVVARKQPQLIVYGLTDTTQLPPKTLRKVDIITGEPNDGMLSTLAPITHLSNELSKNSIPNPLDKLQTTSPKITEEGFVNRVIIGNITAEHETLPLQDTFISSLMKNGDTQVCYRTFEHKYLLGSSFERHIGKSIRDCRCLCAATYAANHSHWCSSFHWYSHGTCILNSGSHKGKYDLIEDHLATYQYVNCDVKVLLEVASKICNQHEETMMEVSPLVNSAKPQIQASVFPTWVTPTTIPNNAVTHTTTEVAAMGASEKQSTGKIKDLPVNSIKSHKIASNVAINNRNLEGVRTNTTEIDKLISNISNIQTSRNAQNSTASTPLSTELSTQRIIEVTNNESSKEFLPMILTTQMGINVTSTEKPIKYTTLPQPSNSARNSQTILNEESFVTEEPNNANDENSSEHQLLSSVFSDCFEEVPGYIMINVAGGLEHDVSKEECKCYCANSKESGRYSFKCASATYYHEERDCILNLENRLMRPHLFEAYSASNVTYIGHKCEYVKKIASVFNGSILDSCRQATPVPFTTTQISRKKNRGVNSDTCFVELSHFVLEGTALAVELGKTPQECKCLCVDRERMYDQIKASYINEKCTLHVNGLSNENKSEEVTTFNPSSEIWQSDEESENSENEINSEELSTEELAITTSRITVKPRKLEKKVFINRNIPEAEGLDEEEFKEDIEKELSAELVSTTVITTQNSHPTSLADSILTTTKPLNKHKKLQGVKTKKFDAKEAKIPAPEETATLLSTTIHFTSSPTTMVISESTQRTTTEWATSTYPPAGRCTYSALYQTAFAGRRLLKTVHVKSPSDCFAACFALRCRSANLIAQGELNSCELFHDSLIDYRRPDMIGYDGSTVYFDGIRCDGE
uniref:Apple domain-containing protein n=1 Tax=Heterorhabditis bacteriophora TaxID=37862 RepID=A0A1I7X5P0_HETBA